MADVSRILLDCTDTRSRGLKTGIQRVVRNIVNCSLERPPAGVTCQPVVISDGRLLPVGRIGRRAAFAYRLLAGPLVVYRILRRSILRVLPFDPLRRFLFNQPAEPGLARMLRALWRGLTWPVRAVRPARHGYIQPRPGDVLVLLDASVLYDPWPAARAVRQAGGVVITIVYDLIPIQACRDERYSFHRAFPAWLDAALSESDGIITISRTVADEIADEVRRRGLSERLGPGRIDWFHLGYDLDEATGRRPRREIEAIFDDAGRDGGGVYVTVGSLTARKNHVTVLEAFERLWQRHPQARWVALGQMTVCADEFLARLRNSGQQQRRAFLFNDATDAELEFCYRRARATVQASRSEGFGLPVVEALTRGCPVLLSDIPVFREVAGPFASYFPPDAPDRLADLLAAMEEGRPDPDRHPPSEFTWPDWRQATDRLLAIVREMSEGVTRSRE
ncbi:MAG: hypothetical protein BIFFINMI_03248 [Phycisphaerae bacterium]|nr:hypothetical protein [Phycisphaerae bacterium]